MRRAIISGSLVGSFVIFCLSINLFETLLMFILFGTLPGESTALSAGSMLFIHTSAAVITTIYLARNQLARIAQAIHIRRPSMTQ